MTSLEDKVKTELNKAIDYLTKYDSSYPINYLEDAMNDAVVIIENLLLDIE